ncbi:hypothetical protein TAMYLO_70278 [Tenacibaculum amylolyticum]
MFRRILGAIYIIGGGILLFSPGIKSEMFEIIGLGRDTAVFEMETMAFITINFLSYTVILFLLYRGIKLFTDKKGVVNKDSLL